MRALLGVASYPNPQPAVAVAQRLGWAAADASHAFWPDDCSPLDAGRISWQHVLGSRQITDGYLLALATGHGGRLVTLDRGIALQAVRGAAARNLLTIPVA